MPLPDLGSTRPGITAAILGVDIGTAMDVALWVAPGVTVLKGVVFGVTRVARGGIEAANALRVGEYQYTRTAGNHVNDIVTKGDFKGELARPYLNSPNTINEIIAGGRGVPDPGGISGALRYDVPGTFRDSQGAWELVVHPETKTIYHFLFK